MIRNPFSSGWMFSDKEIYIEQDHQYHVKQYWDNRFRISAQKAPKIVTTFNPRGCNNPAAFRYPSFEEDPAAYYCAD